MHLFDFISLLEQASNFSYSPSLTNDSTDRKKIVNVDIGDPYFGKRFMNYQIERSLGGGAFGSVYIVRDLKSKLLLWFDLFILIFF